MLPLKIHNFLTILLEATSNNKISWYLKPDNSQVLASYEGISVKIQYKPGKINESNIFFLCIMDRRGKKGSFTETNGSSEDYKILCDIYDYIQAIDLDLGI